MGYHFGPEGLTIAQKTLYNFVELAIRLFEREPREPCCSTRLGEYVKRWHRWNSAGVAQVSVHPVSAFSTPFTTELPLYLRAALVRSLFSGLLQGPCFSDEVYPRMCLFF